MMDSFSLAAMGGAVVATAAVTLLGVLIARNFIGGEKKIERRLRRIYALADQQFAHELGVLLGPPLIPGNRCRLLRNGDEIFPEMLTAIKGARKTITFETYITGQATSAERSRTPFANVRRPGSRRMSCSTGWAPSK
jgi:hypothetical protein